MVVVQGDTFYDEFCKAVDDFDRVFVATGAEKGSECVKCFQQKMKISERLEQFAECAKRDKYEVTLMIDVSAVLLNMPENNLPI